MALENDEEEFLFEPLVNTPNTVRVLGQISGFLHFLPSLRLPVQTRSIIQNPLGCL